MGNKHSVIAAKMRKNREYAAKHKFENQARIALYEVHRKPDYQQNLIEIEEITLDKSGHVIKTEQDENRRIMYAQSAPEKHLTRKKIEKWGKKYWAIYNGCELIRLERRS